MYVCVYVHELLSCVYVCMHSGSEVVYYSQLVRLALFVLSVQWAGYQGLVLALTCHIPLDLSSSLFLWSITISSPLTFSGGRFLRAPSRFFFLYEVKYLHL